MAKTKGVPTPSDSIIPRGPPTIGILTAPELTEYNDERDSTDIPGNEYWKFPFHVAMEIGKRHPKPEFDLEFYKFHLDESKISIQKWGLEELKRAIEEGNQRKRKIDDELVQAADQAAKRVVDDLEASGEVDRFLTSLVDRRKRKRVRLEEKLEEIKQQLEEETTTGCCILDDSSESD